MIIHRLEATCPVCRLIVLSLESERPFASEWEVKCPNDRLHVVEVRQWTEAKCGGDA